MKLDITSAAEADLEEIADYIARDSPVRAMTVVRELYDAASTLLIWRKLGR